MHQNASKGNIQCHQRSINVKSSKFPWLETELISNWFPYFQDVTTCQRYKPQLLYHPSSWMPSWYQQQFRWTSRLPPRPDNIWTLVKSNAFKKLKKARYDSYYQRVTNPCFPMFQRVWKNVGPWFLPRWYDSPTDSHGWRCWSSRAQLAPGHCPRQNCTATQPLPSCTKKTFGEKKLITRHRFILRCRSWDKANWNYPFWIVLDDHWSHWHQNMA